MPVQLKKQATKKPDRRVVCFSAHLNQFDHLPARFITPCGQMEVFTHTQPRYVVGAENKLEFNFDLALLTNTDSLLKGQDSRNDFALETYAPSIRVFGRETKLTQQFRMSEFARSMKLANFRHIRTFKTESTRNSNHALGQDVRGLVVVKPLDGARGMGHLVVNLDAIVPAILMDLLAGAVDGEKFLKRVSELTPHVEYHVGHAAAREGTQALWLQGFVIHEVIPHIKAEYRVITDVDSKPALFVKRARDSLPINEAANIYGYRQATGSVEMTKDINCTTSIKFKHMRELSSLLAKLKIPLNSVDLFITEDDRWGIFEYCPQWGTQGFHLQNLTTWMTGQIGELLRRQVP